MCNRIASPRASFYSKRSFVFKSNFFLVKCTYLITHYLCLKFYFIAATINPVHTLLSTLLDFYAKPLRILKYFAKSCQSLCHLNAMWITIDVSESRTAGNEKSHRRVGMAIIYIITIVPILERTLCHIFRRKLALYREKLFRPENVSKRSTRARYCAVAATDWLVRLHQRYPPRTYQPSYHPLLLPFVPSPLTIFS